MKKIIAFMLALATVFCFAACSGGYRPSPMPEKEAEREIDLYEVKGATEPFVVDQETDATIDIYKNKAAGIKFNPNKEGWTVNEDFTAKQYDNNKTLAHVMTAKDESGTGFSVDVCVELKPEYEMTVKEYAEGMKKAFDEESEKWSEVKDSVLKGAPEEAKCFYIEKNEVVKEGSVQKSDEAMVSSEKRLIQRIYMFEKDNYFVSVVINASDSIINLGLWNCFEYFAE